MSHPELVERAGKWLKSFGCSVVLKELVAAISSGEIPDAIGWKSSTSILIECKTSRNDFHKDKKKPFRRNPDSGMGYWRFYMCLPGVMNKEDLPEGWGLLWVTGKVVRRIVGPKGNWISEQCGMKGFPGCHRKNEVAMLVSALRRENQNCQFMEKRRA